MERKKKKRIKIIVILLAIVALFLIIVHLFEPHWLTFGGADWCGWSMRNNLGASAQVEKFAGIDLEEYIEGGGDMALVYDGARHSLVDFSTDQPTIVSWFAPQNAQYRISGLLSLSTENRVPIIGERFTFNDSSYGIAVLHMPREEQCEEPIRVDRKVTFEEDTHEFDGVQKAFLFLQVSYDYRYKNMALSFSFRQQIFQENKEGYLDYVDGVVESAVARIAAM